jgi:AcrR family transcriptional regulator
MKNTVLKSDKHDTAQVILESAINRFSEYGYNKTTMVEIAEDVGMSAANIYRFYKNKQEIAAACAKNYMHNRTNRLKKVVRDNSLTAVEKLEKFVLTTLEISQINSIENRKIDEICAEITKNRPDIAHEKINNENTLLVEILSYGNQTGEFNVDDVIDTASAIHVMLVMFDVPMFVHLFTKEDLENKARSVSKLLISGLSNKN